VLALSSHHYLPLLLFQIFLYFENLPEVFTSFIFILFQGGWLPGILIYLTVLAFNKDNSFSWWAEDSSGAKTVNDTRIVQFLNFFFVQNDERVNWSAIIVENLLISTYFFILVASVLGYLRWGV
jgi:hypothetical protein